LPQLDGDELRQAVELEAEQYIPVPLKELYLDYSITGLHDDQMELFAVAVPRKVVDSYLNLAIVMGMEPILIETTMAAAGRLFSMDPNSDVATVIIDFGSLTADIGIFDKTILVAGTVPAGGMVFTNLIRDKLKVTDAEAGFIKTKYGLGVSKKQKDISAALETTLQKIVTEIRRMSRYYEERYGTKRTIGQVVILGGGANMPGLGDYLTSSLRMPVRSQNPWNVLEYKGLQPPSNPDKLMYATVAGLSLLNPNEAFLT
jgi:type IV pilus assembly protein PilM